MKGGTFKNKISSIFNIIPNPRSRIRGDIII